MYAIRAVLLALFPGFTLVSPVVAQPAQGLEGTYVSLDDFDLIDAGLIIPIWEYVEIEQSVFRGDSIEVGFVHAAPDPTVVLDIMVAAVVHYGLDPSMIGRFDLENTGRIALIGALEAGDGHLWWTVDEFALATNEPGRLPLEEVRVSPFLAASTVEPAQTVSYELVDGVLSVTGRDGVIHRYARMDPEALRVLGLIAWDQQVSIGLNYACLLPLAETLAEGAIHTFSPEAIEAARAEIASEGEEALAAWAEIERHGFGTALTAVIEAQIEARRLVGRHLQALLAHPGAFDAMVQRYADSYGVLEREQSVLVSLIQRFHYMEIEPGQETAPEVNAVIAEMETRYAADPWSVTGPVAAVMIDRNYWVLQLRILLREEVSRICPDAY